MKKRLYYAMNRREMIWGWIYLLAQLFALPLLLEWINSKLPHPLSLGELNCIFFVINFLAVIWIFHAYLAKNFSAAKQRPFRMLQSAFLGFVGYQLATLALTWLLTQVYPDFNNVNDANITSMMEENYTTLAICTVFIVPLTEEVFYRGLIFQGLYNKSKFLAYAISALVFAAIHVLGYIGIYAPALLALCLVQYIPAGLFLAWSYARCNTIVAPILIHMTVNAMGLYILR